MGSSVALSTGLTSIFRQVSMPVLTEYWIIDYYAPLSVISAKVKLALRWRSMFWL